MEEAHVGAARPWTFDLTREELQKVRRSAAQAPYDRSGEQCDDAEALQRKARPAGSDMTRAEPQRHAREREQRQVVGAGEQVHHARVLQGVAGMRRSRRDGGQRADDGPAETRETLIHTR